MIKVFITSLFIMLSSSPSCVYEDDITYYCWECECSQNGETWYEDYHEYTEAEINQLIRDDKNEPITIYTT